MPRTAAQAQALRQRLQRADAQAIDYSDTPELSDEWFLRAAREGQLATPPAKKPISIKLDEDVLDYFKGHGTRYQTHINAVLRAYMQAQRTVQSKYRQRRISDITDGPFTNTPMIQVLFQPVALVLRA